LNDILLDLSVLGIVITALFTSFGYFYRNYLERKKTIKQVLFYYLELRDVLEKRYMSTDLFMEKYCEYFKSKGFIVSEEMKEELHKSIIELFGEINFHLDKDFINKFKLSIVELSKIDPILAYELYNKEIIFKLMDLLTQKDKIFSRDLHQYMLTDLNLLTLDISKKVSFLTYLDVKNIIKFNRMEESIKIIDEVYGNFFQNLNHPKA